MDKRIMIVDDDPEVLRLYRRLFEPRGIAVLVASDGASALDMLQESTPDLFILDVMMPGMNGVELCQQLRALPQHQHTPVLILSAWSDTRTIEQTFAAGANDYLVKPIHPRDLEARVRELLQVAQGEPSLGRR